MLVQPIPISMPGANTSVVPQALSIHKTISPAIGEPEAASSSYGTSSSDPLATTFGKVLTEAVTGLTNAAAQIASKRVAEFVEHRSRLQVFAKAAGWAPTGSSSASSSGGTSSSAPSSAASSSASSNSNDPVFRLVTALGQALLQALQTGLADADSSNAAQAGADQTGSAQGGTDQSGSTQGGTDQAGSA